LRTQVLASGVGFTEGPVFLQNGDVAFTSIDHGCVYTVSHGSTSVMAVTGGGPNGATEGRSGALYVAQNGGTPPAHRWPNITGGVQVAREGGKVDWLTQDQVSPNDLCFGPDGFLYISDPTRGRSARDDGRIWRCDVRTGESDLLRSVPWYPNGIAFGLEDDVLFVASTGERRIWCFPIEAGSLLDPDVFIHVERGLADGFAFDSDGNLILAAVGTDGNRGEIQTYDRAGCLVDTFRPGSSAKYTNVALSEQGKLIITDADTGSVLTVDGWPTRGLPLHPFRQPPKMS